LVRLQIYPILLKSELSNHCQMFEIKFDDQNKINEELSKSNNQLTKSNEELTNHYRLLETELADQKLLFEQLRKEFNTLFQALTS
jgi:hypothetical protein